MKNNIFIILILGAVLYSCKDHPVEIARFELGEAEQNLVPYHSGQQIDFIHSNGYEFTFNVTQESLEWFKHFDFCEWGCRNQEYFSYQVKTVIMESDYPVLSLRFCVGGDAWQEYYDNVLNFDINQRHFISMPYNSQAEFICDTLTGIVVYDTVLIGTTEYYNVYEKAFDSSFFIDSTNMAPKSILYNSQGLLQIKMSNDETYSVKN